MAMARAVFMFRVQKKMYANYIMQEFVRRNIVSSAIILFIVVYVLIIYARPSFLYNKDGTFRQFGVGYSSKTVIPVWLLAVFLSILCYFLVMFYTKVHVI